MNITRTDGPWRIAYGRELNEAGQIVCRLIPDDQVRAYSTTEAAKYEGVEAVPSLFAVADIYDLSLTVLDGGVGYDETHPNRNCKGLNQAGDVYLQASIPEVGNTEDLFTNEGGTYLLANAVLPSPFDFQLTFNSSPDFGYSVRTPAKGQNETVTLTRRVSGGDEALWSYTSKSYARFSPLGISEVGGSVYTTTVFPGEREIPYHVKSTTERIRIADADCSGAIKWNGRPSLSQALIEGEEELILLDYETNPNAAEYYIYKPNFAARHRIVFSDPLTGEVDVPLTDSVKGGFTGQVVISAPLDGTGTTDPYLEGSPYSGTYFGGYVVFTTSLNDQYLESYLLKPSQAQ
ncbi:MAG: hypothetical protein P1U90_11300 [Akkermansiaceae bacterium]|nr:hypothetical protein [Akkermansiaceae bacterium]